MSRLAWFTPWPPQRSGIAGRSAEVVPLLAARGHGIDVFVDEQDSALGRIVARAPDVGPSAGDIRIQSAHDFVWRQLRRQYDLIVYQLGNSRLHEFIWPYLFRWPGLVVLHDARLHHARGRALLRKGRLDEYRDEFAWNHPEVSPDAAELAVKGFDGAYYYQWPMIRGVLETARLVACHSRGAIDVLHETATARTIEYIALGEGPSQDFERRAFMRAEFRQCHGLSDSAIVFGVFGALSAERRVPQVLRAFAATRLSVPDVKLVLVGKPDPMLGLDTEIQSLRLTDAITIVEDADDDAFDRAVAAVDVSLNLRWPTALETSGPWLRALAMGRASVIIDLAHQGHVPVLDPRTWRRHAPCEDVDAEADARAVAVAVDVLDEDHSLRLAMRRLATDDALREQLGRQARSYWEREHTVARMTHDYSRVIDKAIAQPVPSVETPSHLRPRPAEFPHRLLESFGLTIPDV